MGGWETGASATRTCFFSSDITEHVFFFNTGRSDKLEVETTSGSSMRFCFEVVLRNISRAHRVPVWRLFEKKTFVVFFVKFLRGMWVTVFFCGARWCPREFWIVQPLHAPESEHVFGVSHHRLDRQKHATGVTSMHTCSRKSCTTLVFLTCQTAMAMSMVDPSVATPLHVSVTETELRGHRENEGVQLARRVLPSPVEILARPSGTRKRHVTLSSASPSLRSRG